MITKKWVIDTFEKYKNDAPLKEGSIEAKVGSECNFKLLDGTPLTQGGAQGIDEAKLLYSVIRELKPTNIIEISPWRGLTSIIMIAAIQDNNNKCIIKSYDLEDYSEVYNIKTDKITRTLFLGDVQNIIKPSDIEDCDFLYLDSAHDYNFGKWYCENVIKYLKSGTLIHVHDWIGYDSDMEEMRAVREHAVSTEMVKPIMNTYDEFYTTEQKEKSNNCPSMETPAITQVLVKI